jgi:hypothetical protein
MNNNKSMALRGRLISLGLIGIIALNSVFIGCVPKDNTYKWNKPLEKKQMPEWRDKSKPLKDNYKIEEKYLLVNNQKYINSRDYT